MAVTLIEGGGSLYLGRDIKRGGGSLYHGRIIKRAGGGG